jgi:hypothetical protein
VLCQALSAQHSLINTLERASDTQVVLEFDRDHLVRERLEEPEVSVIELIKYTAGGVRCVGDHGTPARLSSDICDQLKRTGWSRQGAGGCLASHTRTPPRAHSREYKLRVSYAQDKAESAYHVVALDDGQNNNTASVNINMNIVQTTLRR